MVPKLASKLMINKQKTEEAKSKSITILTKPALGLKKVKSEMNVFEKKINFLKKSQAEKNKKKEEMLKGL